MTRKKAPKRDKKTVWLLFQDGEPASLNGKLILYRSFKAANDKRGMMDTVSAYNDQAQLEKTAKRYGLIVRAVLTLVAALLITSCVPMPCPPTPECPTCQPTPTSTVTPTASPTSTAVATYTPTPTSWVSPLPSPTSTQIPTATATPTPTAPVPPSWTSGASGICAAHWIPDGGLPTGVDCGYETSWYVQWKELEPSPGVYDFSTLDEYLDDRPGIRTWLEPQTFGRDRRDNTPKVPQWLFERGAVWHGGTCEHGEGMLAPWDSVYLERLPLLLSALNDYLVTRPEVVGINVASGGMFGEYQLYSCGMYSHLIESIGSEDDPYAFHGYYLRSVKHIVDIYATALPSYPLMIKGSTPPNDYSFINWFARKYRERGYVLWSGLDPTNTNNPTHNEVRTRANEIYGNMFRSFHNNNIPAHFGMELGHPPYTSDAQYQNVFDWARKAGADFLMVQGSIIDSVADVEGFAETDAELEHNSQFPSGRAGTPPEDDVDYYAIIGNLICTCDLVCATQTPEAQ